MNSLIDYTIESVINYSTKYDFIGWDPYDGLTSRLFQSIPYVKKNKLARLAWIQLHKKLPINIRKYVGIKPMPNPKCYAIFLKAFCVLQKNNPAQRWLDLIHYFVTALKSMNQQGYHGACWGYPFDWQSRSFYLPAHTPNAVCTTFVSHALLDAYLITSDKTILELVLTTESFIVKDLHWKDYSNGGSTLSYSPHDYSEVYNVSFLVAGLLARLYSFNKKNDLLFLSKKLIKYSSSQQQYNGKWFYGSAKHHQWVDSFHTGYNLVGLRQYITYTGDKDHDLILEKGFDCYLNQFFMSDGQVKYYDNKIYPLDPHSVSQFILTIHELNQFEKYQKQVSKVILFALSKLYDPSGFFYYQVFPFYTNKIAYMRWSQAWMLLSLVTFRYAKNQSYENLV